MAAKTYYWTDDDGDHDFENPTPGNNWREADGTAAGAGVYPGSAQTDHVVFPAWASGGCTVNVDQSANANGIEDLTVEDGFAHALGSQEAPLVLKVADTPVWTFRGDDHGDLWIVADTGTVAAVHVLATARRAGALNLVFGTNPATLLNLTGGNLALPASLFGVANAGVGTLSAAHQQGVLGQPTLVLEAPVATALNNAGALIDWLAGTIAALNHYEGMLRCLKSTAARTLTASAVYGGTVDLRTGKAGTLTLTAALAYKGGTVLWDIGENLQRS